MEATEKRAVFLAICRRTRYSLSVRKALEQMNEPKSRWRGALAGISLPPHFEALRQFTGFHYRTEIGSSHII